MKKSKENYQNRSIILMGAAMYLDEPVLIHRIIDLALEVNAGEINKEEFEEIEGYVCEQISKKINAKELANKTLRDFSN